MEDGLVQAASKGNSILPKKVLILVVMEDGLVPVWLIC